MTRMWPSTAFITTMRRGSTPHFRWRGVSDWTGLIELTCLDLGTVLVLHLPGEPFIEYQLKAQKLGKDRFVCVAGYGDGGTGYIPTDRAFFEGGYEPTVALAAPCERTLTAALAKLLGA